METEDLKRRYESVAPFLAEGGSIWHSERWGTLRVLDFDGAYAYGIDGEGSQVRVNWDHFGTSYQQA